MHSTAPTRNARRTAVALVALAALAATPLASADHDLDEGCAATPGGWGGRPAGDNAAAALAAHFDEVFPDGLTVGSTTYHTAAEVRAALNARPTDPLLEHTIAITLNLAFGSEGHLDGTLEGVEATSGPYEGWTAEEVLDEANEALMDPSRTTAKYSSLIDTLSAFNNGDYGCNFPPACPALVVAVAQSDGSIRLTWGPVLEAEAYHVYRATNEDGPFLLLDSTTALTYTDSTTAVGQTYHYMVVAFDGTLESEGCAVVSTTAVPIFGAIAGAVALVGTVGAFAWLRRR
jgi:hypothetical protein